MIFLLSPSSGSHSNGNIIQHQESLLFNTYAIYTNWGYRFVDILFSIQPVAELMANGWKMRAKMKINATTKNTLNLNNN